MSSEDNQKNDVFVKGLTWGSYSLSENKMSFKSDNKNWFEIPFNSLSNVQLSNNKTEITLEFNKDDENADGAICELRFIVPESEEKQKDNKKQKEDNKDKENDEKENEEKEVEEEEKKVVKRAEILKDEIIKLANIDSVSDSIARIPEIQAIVPRGKSDIFFLKNSLKIHGQTHNYQIQMKNIIKVFLVPKIDGPHLSYLILKLKSPLTQGNTFYPFLVFQIKQENEIKIELQIPENDEEIEAKLEGLENPLEGKTIDVIAQLFNKIMNKNLIIPSKNVNFSKGAFIKCSYKANDGALYFLEKSILFVHKPVLDIEHESIKEIVLARIQESGMQQKYFDMTIKLKNEKESYQFSLLDRQEMDIFQEYIKSKKIKLNSVDENNNSVDMPNYTTRRRAPVDEELPNLPSEDELGDDDYSDSGEDGDEEEDEEEEVEEKKKKKKNKKKKESED
jgi:structure-specific recognition protein 1